MTDGPPESPAPRPSGRSGRAVYFLSDYGTEDEFVGVVHAVLHRLAPGTSVIDLGHQVPPFDVGAGAAMLVRCGPHLGPGVVLAVVDPGVGTDRRGVALQVPAPGPQWLVGPDNGLLVPLATALGGVRTAFDLGRGRSGQPGGRTFDGRDVFAPAAAHLALGGAPDRIGTPFDPSSLVEPAGPPDPAGPVRPEGRSPEVHTAVSWIDRFGNVQLGVGPETLVGLGLDDGAQATVTIGGMRPGAYRARRVAAFGTLDRGELGLLVDASGRLALVLDRDSAALRLDRPTPGTAVRIGVGAVADQA